MLVAQPPPHSIIIQQTTSGMAGLSERQAMLKDLPLRMRLLYDLTVLLVSDENDTERRGDLTLEGSAPTSHNGTSTGSRIHGEKGYGAFIPGVGFLASAYAATPQSTPTTVISQLSDCVRTHEAEAASRDAAGMGIKSVKQELEAPYAMVQGIQQGGEASGGWGRVGHDETRAKLKALEDRIGSVEGLRPSTLGGKVVGFLTGHSPVTSLHHEIRDAYCWPLSGSQGHLGVALAAPPRTSAPREMEVWGLVEGTNNLPKLKAWRAERATRREAGEVLKEKLLRTKTLPKAVEYVRVAAFTNNLRALGIDFGVVALVVKSNRGQEAFTCLDWFRVHGQIVGAVARAMPYPDELGPS
ncbi:hypothetical protein K438DRAFT_2026005 [Mycena galopus ATCC 62051]|nr:hypothetical protein K438DRAFT_2026005 [Mycena galopus ATCC 62051]